MLEFDIVHDPITHAIVNDVTFNASGKYFYDPGDVDMYTRGETFLTDAQVGVLARTPLSRYLRRFVFRTYQNTQKVVEFDNDEERQLLALLYKHTPAKVISHMRVLITQTLVLQDYSEDFGNVLVENVTEIEAYVNYTPFVSKAINDRRGGPVVPGPANSLLMLMLGTPVAHYASHAELKAQLTHLTNLVGFVIESDSDPADILFGDPNTGETILDLYLAYNGNGQHMVRWLIDIMLHYNVPFVHWHSDPSESIITQREEGSSLHTLMKYFKEAGAINNPRGDFMILPIRHDNIRALMIAMTHEELRAHDWRNRSARDVGVAMYARIRTDAPELSQILRDLNFTTSTKGAY